MGFPTLQQLTKAFKENDAVVFLAIQTVFEGYTVNTRDKLRANQEKYELAIPMAHDPGDPQSAPTPKTMINYRSGGTPWTVIIDPAGQVVFNDFHIKVNKAVALISGLI